MPVDPATITRFTSDGTVHEVTSVRDDDPPLTMAGYYRVKNKCGVTCDCAPLDLEDALRFGTNPSDPVTCLGCLAAP